MKAPFDDIEQEVNITDVNISFERKNKPINGLPQVIVTYEIIRNKNNVDVTSTFKSKVEPKGFNNDLKLFKRSFEPETLFQPVPNDEFISNEETPNVEPFITIGAFDFIIGEMVINNGAYLVDFLKMYILDNYEDGWFDGEI